MLKNEEKNGEKGKKFKIISGVIFALANLFGWFFLYLHPKRWQRFLKKEKQEIKELKNGQENFKDFFSDSSKLLKDLFIPHSGNDHKPLALRPRSLAFYTTLIIFVKLVATGFLFLTYPTPAQLSAIVSSRMVELVNSSRAEEGLPPLTINEELVKAAALKGQNMLERQYFAHDTPDGQRPWELIDRSKYDYIYAGENLAIDFVSAETVQAAFMKSPSHRQNILNQKYKEIGIAVLNGEMSGQKTILLVEFFGTQRKDISMLASTPAGDTAKKSVSPSLLPTTSTSNKKTVAAAVTEEPLPAMPAVLPAESPAESIIVVPAENKEGKTAIDLVIKYSNIFFIAFLIFIFISLLLNILIKIKIQHSALILETIVVIALIAAMLLVKFHFIEQMPSQLLIL